MHVWGRADGFGGQLFSKQYPRAWSSFILKLCHLRILVYSDTKMESEEEWAKNHVGEFRGSAWKWSLLLLSTHHQKSWPQFNFKLTPNKGSHPLYSGRENKIAEYLTSQIPALVSLYLPAISFSIISLSFFLSPYILGISLVNII